ncbi:MAG: hypothetical protein ACXW61_06890 [Gemmatirosa sp.]
MRKTAQRLFAEYGLAAVIVYFSIFFAVLFGAWAAISAGWQPSGALGSVGTFTAAYLVTKVTQPVRIGATLVLAPLAARAWERLSGRRRAATALQTPDERP